MTARATKKKFMNCVINQLKTSHKKTPKDFSVQRVSKAIDICTKKHGKKAVTAVPIIFRFIK
jgi:hypothetical protein